MRAIRWPGRISQNPPELLKTAEWLEQCHLEEPDLLGVGRRFWEVPAAVNVGLLSRFLKAVLDRRDRLDRG